MPRKLDLKDKKILYWLDQNAREPNSKIAKRVGLSKDAVHYRIERLQKGTIRRFYTALNTLALGYLHFNTYFHLQNINEELHTRFVNFCKKEPGVIWCASCYGDWDYSVSYLAKKPDGYQEFITKISQEFGDLIQEKTMALMLDSPTYPRSYLIQDDVRELTYTSAAPYEPDETEHELLKLLSQNARMNVVLLAKELNSTTDIIRQRMKKLERKGILQAYRASIDVDALGLKYYKILLQTNNLTPEKEKNLRQYSKEHPHIIQYVRYAGQWEIQLEVEIAPEEIKQLITNLRNKYSEIIQNYTILELVEEKLNYYPF